MLFKSGIQGSLNYDGFKCVFQKAIKRHRENRLVEEEMIGRDPLRI